ncbi:MAG: hypothetical protein D6820_06975 [Lentisphaerae bacterium]|nr:MAG: hypothetical protein D6820_06975 [Lentisphaerota bacterium]
MSRQPFFDGLDPDSTITMAAAEERIRKYRQSHFTLRFTDGEGKPRPHLQVELELQSHAFQFGANIGCIYRWGDVPDETRQEALQVCDELFSLVRSGEQWSHVQPEIHASHDWQTILPEIEWARHHHKQIRYHCLIYNMAFALPSWKDRIRSPQDWWPHIEHHLAETAARWQPVIHEYDVINEMLSNERLRQLGLEPPSNFPDLSDPEIGAKIFEIAHRHFPSATLIPLEDAWPGIISDPELLQGTIDYFRELCRLTPHVSAIGTQMHFYAAAGDRTPFHRGHPKFGPRAYTMAAIEEWLDRFAAIGLPLHITEFNPPSRARERSDEQPRLSEEEIAAWTTNFYTLVFSKPYIRQLVCWFLIDGVCGRGIDAGLVSVDGRRKPLYHALRELIRRRWHTRIKVVTDEHGEVNFHGFHGHYRLTIDQLHTSVFLDPCHRELHLPVTENSILPPCPDSQHP